MTQQNQQNQFNISRPMWLFLAFFCLISPAIMTVVAIYFWDYVQPVDIFVFAFMYILTGLGITIGFHRYFVHRSFKCKPWMQVLLAILGSMALQGTLMHWATAHRQHHRFSDLEGDPHSPHVGATNQWVSKFKTFFYGHMGWIFAPNIFDFNRYIPDIIANPLYVKVSNYYPLWALLGFIIPGIISGLWTETWVGFWMGVLWGGFVRIFAVQQVTYAINSICHVFGSREYETTDKSRNNFLFGILAFGEGWHNNHHAFPYSARHGLHWWQVDSSFYIIKMLEKLGVAWDMKLPRKDSPILGKEE